MILWRISNHATLDGAGGLRASARWHTKGRRIVYCAPNPATALLEMLVQTEIDVEDWPFTYQLLKIEVPEDTKHEVVNPNELPPMWQRGVSVTRGVGDAWLASKRIALLAVPCVLVPETFNVLINPLHSDSARIRIINVQDHALDGCLR